MQVRHAFIFFLWCRTATEKPFHWIICARFNIRSSSRYFAHTSTLRPWLPSQSHQWAERALPDEKDCLLNICRTWCKAVFQPGERDFVLCGRLRALSCAISEENYDFLLFLFWKYFTPRYVNNFWWEIIAAFPNEGNCGRGDSFCSLCCAVHPHRSFSCSVEMAVSLSPPAVKIKNRLSVQPHKVHRFVCNGRIFFNQNLVCHQAACANWC